MTLKQGTPDAAARTDVLLDRAEQLGRLEGLLARVEADGSGSAVLVRGEAGVGQGARLRRLAGGADGRARTVRAPCEPLLAARPIGPFDDLAQEIGGDLRELVAAGGKPHAVATTLLAELREQGPV